MITSPVSVDLQVGVPDRRKRDLDNRIKPCLDLLEACGVIENDNLVHRLSACWNPALKLEITISIASV
jgi:Holliday junction resolvase RusA-like endonuclease